MAVATLGLAGCAESTTTGDTLTGEAADTDGPAVDPTHARQVADDTASPSDGGAASSQPVAMQACTALVDDGRVVVAAPGSAGMTDEYQWVITAILADGTPRPLAASITRPTDLPPAAERDR